jgi:hypothetical protein
MVIGTGSDITVVHRIAALNYGHARSAEDNGKRLCGIKTRPYFANYTPRSLVSASPVPAPAAI